MYEPTYHHATHDSPSIKTVDPHYKPRKFLVASTAHTKKFARFVPSGPRLLVYIGL
jgi:hypothetical protein